MRSILSYLNIQSKRKIRRVLVLAIVAVLIPVLLFLYFIQYILARPSELEVRTSLQADTYRSGFSWHGAGLTWSTYPEANLVQNPQFAEYTPKMIEPVWQKNGTELAFALHQKIDGEQLSPEWIGANVRLLPFDQNGLRNSSETSIRKIEPVCLQILRSLSAVFQQAMTTEISAFAHRTNEAGALIDSVAVGKKGYVLYNPHLVQPQTVSNFTADDLLSVVANVNGYAALTQKGEIWMSNDGKHWQVLALDEPLPYTELAATDNSFLAWKKDGSLLTIQRDRHWKKSVIRDLFENSVCLSLPDSVWLSLKDGRWVHLGKEQVTYRDGLPVVSKQQLMPVEVSKMKSFGAITYLLTKEGHIYAGDMDKGFKQQTKQALTEVIGQHSSIREAMPSALQFFLLGYQQPMVLLSGQGLWYYNEVAEKWQKVEPVQSGNPPLAADLLPRGIFVTAHGDGSVYLHQLITLVQLTDESLAASVQAGSSLLFTRAKRAHTDPVAWQSSKSTKAEIVYESYKDEGKRTKTDSFLRLRFQGPVGYPSLHLQQNIAISPENWPERRVFTLSLRARTKLVKETQTVKDTTSTTTAQNAQSAKDDGKRSTPVHKDKTVLCLGGDIPKQEFTVPALTEQWQVFRFDFVTKQPESFAKGQTGNLVLELVSGLQELEVSDFYIGERGQDVSGLQLGFAEFLATQKPSILRLSGLEIGRSGRPALDWLKPKQAYTQTIEGNVRKAGGYSIATALDLVSKTAASPWMIINPYATTEEVLALMEYIGGPVYSSYGRLRQKDGRTPPWSLAFPRIYLEFSDQENRLETDKERGDMVDLFLRHVKSSPYYAELKNKLVFVDGMNYSQNEKLSAAEEHATQLPQGFALGLSAEETYQAMLSIFPRHFFAPDVEIREQISQLFLVDNTGKPQRFSRLMQSALVGLGRITSSLLYSLDGYPYTKADFAAKEASDEHADLPSLLRLLGPQASGSHLLTLERSILPGSEGRAERLEKIGSYGFLAPDSAFHLFFTNDTAEEAQIYLEITDEIEGEMVEKIYDERGRLLAEQGRSFKTMQMKIPAGGVAVLEGQAK